MIKSILTLFFALLLQIGVCQQNFQLAPPLLKYKSSFFIRSTHVELLFRQPGAEIRYTLNGEEPNEQDLLYSKPITIRNNCTLKARAFGQNFGTSETVSASFLKEGKLIENIEYSKPNPNYANSTKNVLNDNLGGIPDFHHQNWLGFNTDTVDLWVHLRKKETIQSVLVNFLQDNKSWIFLPERVLLYGYNDQTKSYVQIGEEAYKSDREVPKGCSAQSIKLVKKFKTNLIHLQLFTLKNMPNWHTSKGEHAHLFIDELKVY